MQFNYKLLRSKPFTLLFAFVFVGNLAVLSQEVLISPAMAKNLPLLNTSNQYVGSQKCANCHRLQYQKWKRSDHFKSMAEANENSVLGDFGDVNVTFHGITSHFYQRDGKYWVDTVNENAQKTTFQIQYTFGFEPLQQYLIETSNGHIQAFNVAWDGRSEEKGGQKWFHLRPDEKINPQHPFFWTRHFQNWNSRCADCHSTNLIKNYDSENLVFNTQWSEINVACEACHGAGSGHIALLEENKKSTLNSGFPYQTLPVLKWSFEGDDIIAKPEGEKNSVDINMCGRCHSLRTMLTYKTSGEDFHDSNRIQMLNQTLYFVDGQIKEETFVLGSFLQSKMYEKGVTCRNCHDSHSGKVLFESNELCVQCHKSKVFDSPAHHHHKKESTGAACVNCHMPSRTYMQVDDRRDHSFTIPNPTLSLELGVPNACASCHKNNQDDKWASKQLLTWGVKLNQKPWVRLNHRVQYADPLVTRSLVKTLDDESLSHFVKASLLQQLNAIPSRVSAEAAEKKLRDENPLIRRAAVSSLQGMPPAVRWKLLSPYLKDQNRSVRFQIAETLADVFQLLPVDQRGDLDDLIDEYRTLLAVTADSPATQLSIANLQVQLGNGEDAERAYLQALRIEPYYVPALINLADFYRSTGQKSKIEPLFKRALDVAPDSGGANHSYGLFLIRNKDYEGALPYLKAATEQLDALPRYAHVYAIALDNRGKTDEAVKVLTKANRHWPNQYDLLITQIFYLEQIGKPELVYGYLSALTAIAPNAPDVKLLLKKYGT